MKSIRAVLAVVTLPALFVIDAHPTAAEVYRPWCVQYQGSRSGATNCGFTSYEQCRMTATPGSSGYCVQNPWYLYYGAAGQRRERTRRY
jgi:Protein of unknown function (DUF3551)